nr:transposase [Fusibacter tunisiensis]
MFDRLHDDLVREDIVHADETVLNCLDEKDNKNNYMWLYATGEKASKRIFLYDYQKSRANRHPQKFLENFTGFLQTDGYPLCSFAEIRAGIKFVDVHLLHISFNKPSANSIVSEFMQLLFNPSNII